MKKAKRKFIKISKVGRPKGTTNAKKLTNAKKTEPKKPEKQKAVKKVIEKPLKSAKSTIVEPVLPEEKPQNSAENEAKLFNDLEYENATIIEDAAKASEKETEIKAETISETKSETVAETVSNPENKSDSEALKSMKNMINGMLLLIMIDFIVPFILIKLFSMLHAKFRKIKPKQLKLDAEEKESLEPMADEVVKIIFGKLNVATAFIVSLAFIYATKIQDISDEN